jgi:hypothetical protein
MATAFIAFATSRLVCQESIYPALAKSFMSTSSPQSTSNAQPADTPASRQ